MHLSQYVLPVAILSTGVNAFYPYIWTSSSIPSLASRLSKRFYPFHLSVTADNDNDNGELLTLPLKKRPTVSRRENKYTIVQGNPPTGPNSVTVDEDGNDFSYFFEMEFGSNNQSMWILFDTGGTNSWVFGTDCTVQACEMHNTFGQNDSTTLKMSGSTFSVGYGSGTVSGVFGTDTVRVANLSFQLTFGLANNASNDFVDYPMDGILGLGRSNSSTTGSNTAMETIAKAKLLQNNIVGISLQRNKDGAKDGEVTFGGVDSTKFEGTITYTDVITGTDRWEIPVDETIVAGTPLNLTGKSAIIDTGTSYIFLPPSDASAIHALIPGSTAAGDEFQIPCSTNTTVQFAFSGVKYSVSPEDYVGAATDSTETTCHSNIIGIQTFGSDDWLLGDVFLKNVYSVFDFDQNRIGFALHNGTTATTSPSIVTVSSSSGTTSTATSSSSTTQTTGTANPATAYSSATSFTLSLSLINITTLFASIFLLLSA